MQIQRDPSAARRGQLAAAAALLLLTGGLGGYLIAPARHAPRPPRPAPSAPGPTPPLFPGPRQVAGELPLLEVAVKPADWEKLRAHRDKALADKLLMPDPEAVVPVAVRIGTEMASGTVRLKGDWIDHFDTDQWSLRFELDTPVRGMRRFAVQHPKTRGYVMEWLVMKTAERLGVLAPHAEFVHVAVAGREPAVYYLEERPGKEMLERQGRRDGPILKFDENALWSTERQMNFLTVGALPADFGRMYEVFDAPVEVMGEGRLVRDKTLEQRVHRALQQARELQAIIIGEDLAGDPVRAQQALRQLQGRTIEDLFVVDKLGKLLALYTFYQGFHGLHWNQLRLYHDPVLDRLEPIANDTDASFFTRPGELALHAFEARWFHGSHRVMVAAYEELGRLTAPGFVEQLIAELRGDLERAAAAMKAAGIEIPGFDVLDSLDALLRQQVERLRAFIHPAVAASFDARVVGVRQKDGEDLRAVEVDARATTRVPTRVSGFVLGNGRMIASGAALVGIADQADSVELVTRLPDGGVLLPIDGRALRFRFPVDQRLLALDEVRAIKQAIRQQLAGPRLGQLDIAAACRPVTENEDRRASIVLRRQARPEESLLGRPSPPGLLAALQRHPFLVYDLERRELQVRAGSHIVDGDLILPDEQALHLLAGAELCLQPGKVLVAGALVVAASRAQPARLVAADPAQGFGGVVILGSAGASRCTGLVVAGATAIERGGWQTTGGVTFLRARVDLQECTFAGARGEDALNLIRCDFRMQGCRFDGGPHDLFDGDFVDGAVVDCTFEGSGEDAIDVSGSRVTVQNCTFRAIGDKALSVGEGSRLTARDCRIVQAAIAMASKDRSIAIAERLTVDAVEHYVFACYVKKPEFGASELRASQLTWHDEGPPRHLAQTGCTIEVDGATVPTSEIDVEQLYRDKVLGK